MHRLAPPPLTLSKHHQASLPNLKDVVFCGNPFWEDFEGDVPAKRVELLKHLPNLTKIDGELVTPGERTAAAE